MFRLLVHVYATLEPLLPRTPFTVHQQCLTVISPCKTWRGRGSVKLKSKQKQDAVSSEEL